jgi:hypothetical protein
MKPVTCSRNRVVGDQRKRFLEDLDEPPLPLGKQQVHHVEDMGGERLTRDPVRGQSRPLELDIPGPQHQVLRFIAHADLLTETRCHDRQIVSKSGREQVTCAGSTVHLTLEQSATHPGAKVDTAI